MPRSVIGPLIAGGVSGLMFVAINFIGLAGIPLFLFALVPTLATGLTVGLGGALYAIGATIAIAGAVGGVGLAINYLVLFAAPQAWMLYLALHKRESSKGPEWYPPGRLVAWLSGIAVGFLIAATIMFAGTEGGLTGMIQSIIEDQLRVIAAAFGQSLTDSDIRQTSRVIAASVPVATAFMWVLMMVANGALAQAAAERSGRNIRPRTAFADLVLPDILMYGLGAAMLFSLAPGSLGDLGKTLAYVITVAYFILGLAVIHAVARGLRVRRVFLVGTYVLVVAIGGLAVVLVILGLAEHVFELRRRFFAPKKNPEKK